MTKTDAAHATLQEINPDVIYEAHTYNITKLEHYDHFLARYVLISVRNKLSPRISHGSKDGKSPVDLVLCCVDNFEARITVNQVRQNFIQKVSKRFRLAWS